MTVNDEIGQSSIQDGTQLTVSEHPVLSKRLLTERGRGRSEVEHRDAHVRIQGKEGSFQRLTLTAGTNSQPLQRPRVNRIWPLMWPKPTAAAGRPGDADARSVRQANDGGTPVEHLDTRAFEHTPERHPAQRSQVVVAKHRNDRQSGRRQELSGQLGLEEATVLSEIAGDKQEVGMVRKGSEARDGGQVFSTADVEVTNRSDPDP
jgi:hypothetical protein